MNFLCLIFVGQDAISGFFNFLLFGAIGCHSNQLVHLLGNLLFKVSYSGGTYKKVDVKHDLHFPTTLQKFGTMLTEEHRKL